MTTIAAPGWGRAHLPASPPDAVHLDAAEQLAVHRTLARYAFALDQRDTAALTGVLTEDATWTFTVGGEVELGPFAGHAAILNLVRGAMDAQTDQRRHHLTNVMLHGADAGTAVARAYLVLTSNAGGSPRVVATGFYTFTLRRVAGEWRIAELLAGLDNAE